METASNLTFVRGTSEGQGGTRRDKEGQGETKQNNCEGQTVSLAIQQGFCEVVLLFFFLLVCEILSPVCPPKISFKNSPLIHSDLHNTNIVCVGK